jgi:hypothetical protein
VLGRPQPTRRPRRKPVRPPTSDAIVGSWQRIIDKNKNKNPPVSEAVPDTPIFAPTQPPHGLRPTYYGGADALYEAIKVIEAWGLNFSLGCAVKYIARAGKKNPATSIEDLIKARQYIDFEIDRQKREASQ